MKPLIFNALHPYSLVRMEKRRQGGARKQGGDFSN
jgi:hypothetical protein